MCCQPIFVVSSRIGAEFWTRDPDLAVGMAGLNSALMDTMDTFPVCLRHLDVNELGESPRESPFHKRGTVNPVCGTLVVSPVELMMHLTPSGLGSDIHLRSDLLLESLRHKVQGGCVENARLEFGQAHGEEGRGIPSLVSKLDNVCGAGAPGCRKWIRPSLFTRHRGGLGST